MSNLKVKRMLTLVVTGSTELDKAILPIAVVDQGLPLLLSEE